MLIVCSLKHQQSIIFSFHCFDLKTLGQFDIKDHSNSPVVLFSIHAKMMQRQTDESETPITLIRAQCHIDADQF